MYRNQGRNLVKQSTILVIAALVLSVATANAGHSFATPGWSGPIAGGGTTSSHPENLCNRPEFFSKACVIASVSSLGAVGLRKWPVSVSNTGGMSNVQYTTNNTSTPGWIVVVGNTGLFWTIVVNPGSFNGQFCSAMNPGNASGFASTAWGSSRFFHKANFYGSFAGGHCSGI